MYKYTLVITTMWLIDASVSSGLCAPIVELVPGNKHQRRLFQPRLASHVRKYRTVLTLCPAVLGCAVFFPAAGLHAVHLLPGRLGGLRPHCLEGPGHLVKPRTI